MSRQENRRHPIIIGVGQVTHRDKIPDDGLTALDLAEQAIHACIADTGREDLLGMVDSLSVVNISTEAKNHPEEKLCGRLGIQPAVREQTAIGGNTPQWLVNRTADRIASGEIQIALMVGAEATYLKKGIMSVYTNAFWDDLMRDFQTNPSIVGDVRFATTPQEKLSGADRARHIYPLFENALRGRLGKSLADYRKILDDYYQFMAQTAKGNPLAWFNQGYKIDGNVTVPTDRNPNFNFPYTKFMNPNPAVNQAAAIVMTDTDTARRLSIPRDQWVFLHAGADANDKWFISDRLNYCSSPAIRANVTASLQQAGLALSDISFFDLYSCFPCAPLIAALEIGLDIDPLPPLSITGGLSYFGGPGSNYATHAIAHTVLRLRKHPEQFGLVTALGWYLTKHSAGIYSGVEPQRPWDRTAMKTIQAELDAMPSPVFCERPQGRLRSRPIRLRMIFSRTGPPG